MKSPALYLVVTLILACVYSAPAAEEAPGDLYIATWNVENLFDDVDDPGRHDDSLMEWYTTADYQLKLRRLAEVISLMNDGQGPDVLGLQEVENEKVLRDLVKLLPDPEGYTIVHEEAGSSRSIEVALITRFPVLAYESHFVWHYNRDILEVRLDVHGHPLTVLVNHWKSRYGGTLETAMQRFFCATRAYQLYTQIVREDPNADIVILGDFNDTPHNISLEEGLRATGQRAKVINQYKRYRLYNATTELMDEPVGTHYWDDEWSFLDQIILSHGLLIDDELHYVVGSIHLFNPDGMLTPREGPWRFGWQHERNRGYSDHLPLAATLRVKRAAEALEPEAAATWPEEADLRRREHRLRLLQAWELVEKRLARQEAPALVVGLHDLVLDHAPYRAGAAAYGYAHPQYWLEWLRQDQLVVEPVAQAALQRLSTRDIPVFYLIAQQDLLAGEREALLARMRALELPNADAEHLLDASAESVAAVNRDTGLVAAVQRISDLGPALPEALPVVLMPRPLYGSYAASDEHLSAAMRRFHQFLFGRPWLRENGNGF